MASYPGSGNTWLRLNLEQTSQVLTGSIYTDKFKALDFAGEGQVDRVVIVKSHAPWHGQLGAHLARLPLAPTQGVVHLVRHPFAAIASYWNWIEETTVRDSASLARERRQRLSWIEVAAETTVEMVRGQPGAASATTPQQRWTAWRDAHFGLEARGWLAHSVYFVRRSVSAPVLAVRYEDLSLDAPATLRSVLAFLRSVGTLAPRPAQEDERMIACSLAHQERTRIHRAHREWRPGFTDYQRAVIWNITNSAPYRLGDFFGYTHDGGHY